MKKLLLLTVLSGIISFSFAQTASIKGITTDTINKQNLANTVITLLRAKDSVMVKFTRSDANGNFEMKNLKAGDYLMLVTYPQYADYTESITLTDTSAVNTGLLKLILKANLLKEVIVKQQLGSIRLKGDTTEFIADSFKVQANANVEELLKKIPSIQIDKNGKITAQGETVKKVLVEGEEFFGDDPTLVTQNLRADMVASVQIYDKKSDQATFTGVDDGQREKTINLKLKDGKKNGYFGKINLGGGTHGYFDNSIMANYFKNKEKFAGYAIVSNTGKTGLNWQDAGNYGDNPFAGADPNEGIYINSDELDSWSGNYEGQGYPRVQTGGVHYNNKWNDDKQSVNANYKIMQLHVDGESGSQSQTLLHDTIYYNRARKFFSNKILRNRANGYYEVKLDSTSSIKITADGGTDHKMSNSLDSTETRFTDSSLINQNRRSLNTTGDKRTVNSTLLYRKKFKKQGRTLSFNIRQTYSNDETNGYLKSNTALYKGGQGNGSLITDQLKTYNSENLMFDTRLTYTEPLSKAASIAFNYGIVVDNSKSHRSSYNKTNEGKYADLDSVYSNNYKFNTFTQRTGVNLNYNTKKFRFNVGNNLSFTDFTQTDLMRDTVSKRNFVNWNPNANFGYNFTQSRRINFYYYGYTQQPSIQQIQPVRTNDDPLNIVIGNANLKPSFQNYMSLSFNDYKMIGDRGIWLRAFYNFTQNQISNRSVLDDSGKTTTQYVNLNGNHTYGLNADYSFKIKKWNLRTGFNSNINLGQNVSIQNGLLNTTNNNSYGFGIYLGKEKENKFNINLNANANYNTSVSSIQTNTKTQFWSFDLQPWIDIYLPLKFQIHTDGSYTVKQKTAVLPSTSFFILNGWVGKKFMKNDAMLIKISGNDILNQNIGLQRYTNSNIISQSTYSTIRRYFLLSVVWNFTKSGIKAPSNN